MTRTLSLVAILSIASISAASAAPAGGMHRGGAPAAAPGGGLHRGGSAVTTPGLRKSFGGSHGVHRHNRFLGSPWIAAVPYETPPADVSVNNQFVVQAPPARRVCRSEVLLVPREAGGEREVTVTRCFLE
jgi:hypothetical protein